MMRDIRDKVEEAEKMVENMTKPKEQKLSETKGFITLPILTNPAEYDDWSFKIKSFLEGQHVGFHGFLKNIEKDVNDETDAVEVAKVMQTWKVVD